MVITSSVLQDVTYSIGFYEVLQAVGILGIIGFVFVLGIRFLRFPPHRGENLRCTHTGRFTGREGDQRGPDWRAGFPRKLEPNSKDDDGLRRFHRYYFFSEGEAAWTIW